MAAVVVVFWSLVVWRSGRWGRGTLVASAADGWSLVAGIGGAEFRLRKTRGV
jgi:hypothetical protein